MSKDRINDLLLKSIKENLFEFIFDKEQRKVVSAEIFKTLLNSGKWHRKEDEDGDRRLYSLGIYANMFLQSMKVDPSLLSKEFLLKYIYFAKSRTEITYLSLHLNTVTRWSGPEEEASSLILSDNRILKDSNSHIATIFRNLSKFYTPAKSFSRVRKVFDEYEKYYEDEIARQLIFGKIYSLTYDFADKFERYLEIKSEIANNWSVDIFEYRNFLNLNVHSYSGNFDLLKIIYEEKRDYKLIGTLFDWTHLGFYIINQNAFYQPSLSTYFFKEKLYKPSNIISANAYFKGPYKKTIRLHNATVLLGVVYGYSKKLGEKLFKKFYMMILMQLEMEIPNITIHIQHLIGWTIEESRNLQIKSLIRAKDAHRKVLTESKKTVTLVINLNLQDNKTIPQNWNTPKDVTRDVSRENLPKLNDKFKQILEYIRNYNSKTPTFSDKDNIFELILNIKKMHENLKEIILDTDDNYLVEKVTENEPVRNNFVGQILMYIRNELVQGKNLVLKLFLEPSGFFAEEMINMQIDVKRERPVFIFLPEESSKFYGGEIDENLLEESLPFLQNFINAVYGETFSTDLKQLFQEGNKKNLLSLREKHPYYIWGGDPYLEEIPFEKYRLEDMNLLENPIKIEKGKTSLYRTLSFILLGKEDYFLSIKSFLFMFFLNLLHKSPEFELFTELDFSYLQKFLEEILGDKNNNPPIITPLLPLFFKRTVITFTENKINFYEIDSKLGEDKVTNINPICMFFSGDEFTALPSAYTHDTWEVWKNEFKQKKIEEPVLNDIEYTENNFFEYLSRNISYREIGTKWELSGLTKDDVFSPIHFKKYFLF